MRLLFSSIIFVFLFQNQSKIEEVSFLEGTWKIENKQTYEVWDNVNATILKGNSYIIVNGEKRISEYLKIELKDNKLIYSAKVLNQNNQQEIAFILNKAIKDKMSFENLAHDFPKKIQYTKLNPTEIFVEVLGENNQGFSFKMIKQ